MKVITIGGARVAHVTNKGCSFRVRLVRKSDTYGRDNALTHTEDEPMVEFYDATYAGADGHTPLGQFVNRYNFTTLTADNGHGRVGVDYGLDLYGGEPEWMLDLNAAAEALAWAAKQVQRTA